MGDGSESSSTPKPRGVSIGRCVNTIANNHGTAAAAGAGPIREAMPSISANHHHPYMATVDGSMRSVGMGSETSFGQCTAKTQAPSSRQQSQRGTIANTSRRTIVTLAGATSAARWPLYGQLKLADVSEAGQA